MHKVHNLLAMVTAPSNPFNLLVGAITSPKKVTLVNNIIEVKQIDPIKVRQLSRLQLVMEA